MDLLTVQQAAALCQVCPHTIYRRISNGYLRAYRLGNGVDRAYRVRLEDVLQPVIPGRRKDSPGNGTHSASGSTGHPRSR